MINNLLIVHGIGWKIHNAFWQILYNIFVKFPLYFVAGVGDVIGYLSGRKISNLIFNTQGHKFGIDPLFLDFLLIAATLMLIFSCTFLIHVALQHTVQKEIGGLISRVISGLVLILLIPVIFFSANFLVISLIRVLLRNQLSGTDLANQIGNLGWTDNKFHTDWNFWHVPDFDQGYSLFLGTFGSFFCLVIFFILGLTLVKRIFDLFLLYVISPVVISTAASGARWSKISLWKDLVIARFISSLGIILAVSLFLSLSPRLFVAGKAVGSAWYQKTALSLLFLCGAAVATLQSQQLFSALAGSTVGIQDGLSMLTTLKTSTAGAKAGALGLFGLSKGLFKGGLRWKNKIGDRLNGAELKPQYSSGLKGVGERVHQVARVGASAVLAGAGFLAGTVQSVRHLGVKKTIRLGAKSVFGAVKVKVKNKISTKLQTPAKIKFQKGFKKHQTAEVLVGVSSKNKKKD